MSWGTPKMDGLFHGKSQSKMDDDWGYPHYWKPPYDWYGDVPILGDVKHWYMANIGEKNITSPNYTGDISSPDICLGDVQKPSSMGHATFFHWEDFLLVPRHQDRARWDMNPLFFCVLTITFRRGWD